MQNRFLNTISPSTRLIVLIILIISLLIARSIYLVLFITTFVLIMSIVSKTKLKEYVKFIKNFKFSLLFFLILYIIFLGQNNIYKILIFGYKEIMLAIMIKIFSISINFKELNSSIYNIFRPFKFFDWTSFSLDMTFSLYLIKYWIESKDKIINNQLINSKRNFGIRKYFIPRILYTAKHINRLKDRNILNFSNLTIEKYNLKSKLVFVSFITFFVICLFKEVIL